MLTPSIHEGPLGARAELEILREWPSSEEQASCAVSRQTPSAQLRVRHDDRAVMIFGRTDTARYTWQYNLDCELTAVGEAPESAFETTVQ